MHLQLASLSQDVSFEDGSVTNFIVLRTPSGRMVRAVVTDEGAKVFVEEFAARQGASAPSLASQPSYAPTSMNDEGAVVFGGDAPSEEERSEAASFWSPDEPPSVAPAQEPPKSQKRGAKATYNARTVPKDDAGYPIMRGSGVDPGEIMGSSAGGAVDDEGVGSI